MKRVQIAVGHSILVSAYHLLSHHEPYRHLGPDWLNRRNTEAHTRLLVRQLEQLGHHVAITPAA
jgi:transposase